MRAGHELPANATAARVVARGESFEYEGQGTEVCSGLPLATRKLAPNQVDLTGSRAGRLTVIGPARDVKARWVCRCVCGNYTYRRAATITKAAPDAACQQCYLMAVSRRQEIVRRTGRWVRTEELMK